jgi:tetratricopeptide (TPR) repeat protein
MTDHAQKSEKKGGLDQVKRWIGLGAALLSLGSAVFGVLHAQAARRARVAEASELMASGRLQEKAGDYPHAWDSFQKAAKLTSEDGMISRFIFGKLSKQEAEAHDALEELAEKWVRDARGSSDPQGLAGIGDKAVKMLSDDVATATGEHKADLLAHIGYAYYLKSRDGAEGGLQPVTFYRDAVAADPHNPYAQVFWGHLILYNGGSVAEAKQHFADALASNREHDVVRRFELAGLENQHSDEADAAWLQVVNEMHKAGEPVSERVAQALASRYYFASSNENERKALYAAVPPAEQAELARWLLKSGNAKSNELSVRVMLAYSLEAAGRKEEALAAWQDVETTVKGDATIYNTVTREAIKRLGGGAAARSR